MGRPSKVHVVAAWEPELERFRALVAEDAGLVRGTTLNMAAVGVGAVDAALGAMRCITQHRPDRVVLLGTCGAMPSSGLAIGDVVVGRSAFLADAAVLEGRAAMPYLAEAIPLDAGLVHDLVAAGARPARIVNTLGVTTDDALATKLTELGDVEHLEAYAVARACVLASVPCAVVLGVANVVGSSGREQWRANHLVASARAAEVAVRVLKTSTTERSPA
jgi:nucleoside phosphorylase